MAISQPTYPIVTTALVSHVGAYADARDTVEVTARNSAIAAHESDTSVHGIADTTALATDAEVVSAVNTHSADTTAVHGLSDVARAVGSCVYSGGAYPSRPTGYALVIWVGPTDPGVSASNNDVWVPTA